MKNEEIQNFIYSLKQMMQNVEVLGSPLPSPWGPPGTLGSRVGVAPTDTPGHCDQANSSRAQEDLENEFQSLYALLDELKDQMLMKIKQDRASRTYELQVSARPACPPLHWHPRPLLPLSLPTPGPAGSVCQGPGELGGAAGGSQPGPGDSQPP